MSHHPPYPMYPPPGRAPRPGVSRRTLMVVVGAATSLVVALATVVAVLLIGTPASAETSLEGAGAPQANPFPLAAPPRSLPQRYECRAWTRFAPVTVIVIQPAPVVINDFTVVNIRQNTSYRYAPPRWTFAKPEEDPSDLPLSEDPTDGTGTGTGTESSVTTTTPTSTTPTSTTETTTTPDETTTTETTTTDTPTTTTDPEEPGDGQGAPEGDTTGY